MLCTKVESMVEKKVRPDWLERMKRARVFRFPTNPASDYIGLQVDAHFAAEDMPLPTSAHEITAEQQRDLSLLDRNHFPFESIVVEFTDRRHGNGPACCFLMDPEPGVEADHGGSHPEGLISYVSAVEARGALVVLGGHLRIAPQRDIGHGHNSCLIGPLDQHYCWSTSDGYTGLNPGFPVGSAAICCEEPDYYQRPREVAESQWHEGCDDCAGKYRSWVSGARVAAYGAAAAVTALRAAIEPTKFIVEERPLHIKKKRARKDHREAQSHFITLDKAETKARIASKSEKGDAPCQVAPHERRGHFRTLTSERFTKKRGQRVWTKACWVGPTEGVVGKNKYIVRLDK